MADEAFQGDASAAVDDARFTEAVASKILRGLWPHQHWDRADEHVKALCLGAARAAIVTVRLVNSIEEQRGGTRLAGGGAGPDILAE